MKEISLNSDKSCWILGGLLFITLTRVSALVYPSLVYTWRSLVFSSAAINCLLFDTRSGVTYTSRNALVLLVAPFIAP